MERKLDNKTALVTGGAKRLGRAVACELATLGANVCIHFHSSRDAVQALAEELEQQGVNSWIVAADLASRSIRSRADGESIKWAAGNFNATMRSMSTSRALSTVPMPPLPTTPSTSNRPTRPSEWGSSLGPSSVFSTGDSGCELL